MVINKIEEKTMYLYRKWVWLGVELGHRDPITVTRLPYFIVNAYYFCVSMRIGVQVADWLQQQQQKKFLLLQNVQVSQ